MFQPAQRVPLRLQGRAAGRRVRAVRRLATCNISQFFMHTYAVKKKTTRKAYQRMTVGIGRSGKKKKGANHPTHDSRARTTERPRALAYVREGVFVTAPAPRGRSSPPRASDRPTLARSRASAFPARASRRRPFEQRKNHDGTWTRLSCSSDSVAASDLSESAADLETMNHGIFEAQAAMATQAGRMSQFAGGDDRDPLGARSDMLRVHHVRFNGRSQPGADKFLRESFVAMKRLWMDRSFNGPVVTLTELTTWKFTSDDGGALVVDPARSWEVYGLRPRRRADEDACDSGAEAGFDSSTP